MLSRKWLAPVLVSVCWIPALSAQSAVNQLQFFQNYFVTGDYVVGGVGLRGTGVGGVATGTISIPDLNQPVPASVPAGADIVAAFLYWQTVEKTQSSLAGQTGFFNGFAITGTILGNPNAPVSWSSGGCAGNAQGATTLRTYRADVRPYLNLDSNGSIQGNLSWPVKLADSGSNGGGTPLTLGATLVLIYASPGAPLNAISLYDGSFAPSNGSSSMSQTMEGFFQPSLTPIAKVTHIVGNGQANKSEQVFLNNQPLPSLYSGLPPFPGHYNASWDNPTWTNVNQYGDQKLVKGTDTVATTSVQPSSSNSGCVSWGAIIFGTTVQDTDNDGLLDIWENNQGYTDTGSSQWVALPGANSLKKDIFVELDYLSNLDKSASTSAHSHLPKQDALEMVGDAFKAQSINVHFDLGPNVYQQDKGSYVIRYPIAAPPSGTTAPPGTAGGNAISEGLLVCTDSSKTLCPFPGQASTAWKGGFNFVQKAVDATGTCLPGLGCFQPGRRHSYHYVLFGHASGSPRSSWGTAVTTPNNVQGTLTSIQVDGSGTATVTLQSAANFPRPGDDPTLNRVTIMGWNGPPPPAATLNGTYNFKSLSTGDANTKFTISAPGIAAGTYDLTSQPQLVVMYGGPTSTSGHSDLRGADSMVTFGLWPADDAPGCQADPSKTLTSQQTYCNDQVGTVQAQAGTLMHELGHTLGLTHGGFRTTGGTVTYGLNCKPNFLSVMNYLFQIRGFPDLINGGVDYSGVVLPNLDETQLSESAGIGPATHFTRWYAPPNALDKQLQLNGGGRYAISHCDGTPIGPNENAVRVDGTMFSPIDWNNDLNPNADGGVISQDVNFDGKREGSLGSPTLSGFSDWGNLDLRQIGARENAFGLSAGGGVSFEGGGVSFEGGGVSFEGGGVSFEGGGVSFEGGGVSFEGGGVSFEGGGEQNLEAASATADPVANLSAGMTAGAHSVTLTWTPPGFGQNRKYFIWRAVGSFKPQDLLANLSLFSQIKTLSGTPPSTTSIDTNVKNNTTYTYFVTAQNAAGAQSGPSKPFTITVKF